MSKNLEIGIDIGGTFTDIFIKDLDTKDEIHFDKDFGFDTANYKNQVTVSYDSGKDQTVIDIKTSTFDKKGLVVIDGNHDVFSNNPNLC